MPLLVSTLADGLTELFELIQTRPTIARVTQGWCDAYDIYMTGMVYPPAPGLVVARPAAKAAMSAVLLPGLTVGGPAAITALTAALAAYTGVLAVPGALAPFVVVPPPAPFVLAPMPPAPSTVAALLVATQLHLWTITGTASVPPLPPVVWS